MIGRNDRQERQFVRPGCFHQKNYARKLDDVTVLEADNLENIL